MPFIAADQTYEVAMTIEHCPNTCDFSNRAFTTAACHRQGEQTSMHDGLLNLIDDLDMVRRPGKMKRERKVCLTKVPEVTRCTILAIWVIDLRQFANITTGKCKRCIAYTRSLLHRIVWIDTVCRTRRMSYDMHPSTIAKQVNGLVVANACAGALTMPIELSFADHLA